MEMTIECDHKAIAEAKAELKQMAIEIKAMKIRSKDDQRLLNKLTGGVAVFDLPNWKVIYNTPEFKSIDFYLPERIVNKKYQIYQKLRDYAVLRGVDPDRGGILK